MQTRRNPEVTFVSQSDAPVRVAEADGPLPDITDREATEAALRETKKRLELFIEHAPAALAMYDRNMRYLAVSRRWREIYAVEGEIIGKCHYDVVPDTPERWKQAHRKGLA